MNYLTPLNPRAGPESGEGCQTWRLISLEAKVNEIGGAGGLLSLRINRPLSRSCCAQGPPKHQTRSFNQRQYGQIYPAISKTLMNL